MNKPGLEQATKLVSPWIAALQARCQENPELPGIDVVIDLVVLIAGADGAIDEQEQAALRKTIQELSGGLLTEAQLTREVASSAASILSLGPEEKAKRLGEALRGLAAEEDGLRLGAAVAYISRGISAEERAILVHIADAAGVPQEKLGALLKETRRFLEQENG